MYYERAGNELAKSFFEALAKGDPKPTFGPVP
jgi:hypothetical protein